MRDDALYVLRRETIKKKEVWTTKDYGDSGRKQRVNGWGIASEEAVVIVHVLDCRRSRGTEQGVKASGVKSDKNELVNTQYLWKSAHFEILSCE